jgi:hypothetical protein
MALAVWYIAGMNDDTTFRQRIAGRSVRAFAKALGLGGICRSRGDVSRGALVTKIVERRCVMLGLHTPQSAVLQIVDETKPKETSIDKIERVLAEFAAQKKDDPTTH